jgi:hypothetical protein
MSPRGRWQESLRDVLSDTPDTVLEGLSIVAGNTVERSTRSAARDGQAMAVMSPSSK